jgi:hypothetical protein
VIRPDPPDIPTVDVLGYQPPPAAILPVSVVSKCPIHGIVWARPGTPPCDCDEFLDADP